MGEFNCIPKTIFMGRHPGGNKMTKRSKSNRRKRGLMFYFWIAIGILAFIGFIFLMISSVGNNNASGNVQCGNNIFFEAELTPPEQYPIPGNFQWKVEPCVEFVPGVWGSTSFDCTNGPCVITEMRISTDVTKVQQQVLIKKEGFCTIRSLYALDQIGIWQLGLSADEINAFGDGLAAQCLSADEQRILGNSEHEINVWDFNYLPECPEIEMSETLMKANLLVVPPDQLPNGFEGIRQARADCFQ